MVTVSQEEQEQGFGTYGPRGTWRQAGAGTKRGLRGFDPPLGQATSSAQKEDTRSLSMVQES